TARLDIGGSWQKMRIRSMHSTKPRCPLAPGTTFRPAHAWNTIRDTTPLMYSTQTGIHLRSSIKANDRTAHHKGERSAGRNRRPGASQHLRIIGSRVLTLAKTAK